MTKWPTRKSSISPPLDLVNDPPGNPPPGFHNEIPPEDFSYEELANSAAQLTLNLPSPAGKSSDSAYNPDTDVENVCSSDSQQEHATKSKTPLKQACPKFAS